MNRTHLYFLLGGILFGALVGAASFNFVERRRDAETAAESAQAAAASAAQERQSTASRPAAPTAGGGGGAPMVALINELKGRLQENPDDLEALGGLANLYHDAGMWEQAIGYYERAIEVAPDSADLMTDMGICYRNNGEPQKALALFERAQKLAPDHWQSLFNTVIVAGFDLQDYDLAESALAKMEALDPPPPRVDELREALEKRRDGASG